MNTFALGIIMMILGFVYGTLAGLFVTAGTHFFLFGILAFGASAYCYWNGFEFLATPLPRRDP